jgi:hypothetical protein
MTNIILKNKKNEKKNVSSKIGLKTIKKWT